MKKLYCITAVIAIFASVLSAQTQLPNSGFEDWYDTGIDDWADSVAPNNWDASNIHDTPHRNM